MSLYSRNLSPVTSYFPGTEVLQIEQGLGPEAFAEFVATLTVPEHADMQGSVVLERPASLLENVVPMLRDAAHPRDPWAADHQWHADMTFYGETPLEATVVYARELAGIVATTSIIDTTLLLQSIERDQPGFTEEIVASTATFSKERYYREVLPTKGASYSIELAMKEEGAKSLEEVIASVAAKFPPKTLPAVPIHPFRGLPCTTIDAIRVVSLSGINPARSRQIIEMVRDQYLDLPHEELQMRPYYAEHNWEAGQALIIPQIGALHRAEPSPEDERIRSTLKAFVA